MGIRTISTMLLAAGAALALTSRCPAPDARVYMEEYEDPEWSEHGYEGLKTYRLYSSYLVDSGVLSTFGAPGSPIWIRTGTQRMHNAGGEMTAPVDLRPLGIYSNQWDSYVTINATDAAGDDTFLSPGFAQDANGLRGNFTIDNGGWLVTPESEQRLPDEQGRVLLAQFTVEPSGCNVAELPDVWGVINILEADGTDHYEVAFVVGNGKTMEFPCYDLNDDGFMDFGDVIVVIMQWGDAVPCKPDLNRNGIVDFPDLLIVLREWGPCFVP